jgi:hypothetical protein
MTTTPSRSFVSEARVAPADSALEVHILHLTAAPFPAFTEGPKNSAASNLNTSALGHPMRGDSAGEDGHEDVTRKERRIPGGPVWILRKRDGIAIEESADQMDGVLCLHRFRTEAGMAAGMALTVH